ncbi:MAG: Asp-tRNA(Asn)/Glu-tRNA(Gln) amidotransferase subunit GatC [Alphaproteobacteria bacterium]|nr:Asp-tRNA(Asn)/Glu-tRNA(Gln) amidotransferase subunit GatC [Alphaproteobacteria bacterium]
MSVSVDDVKKVSKLAKIKVSDEKVVELQRSLNNVLDFVEQLSEIDCSMVDDSVQYSTKIHERKDIVIPTDPTIMSNAPEKECNMFVVPKVIG